ncbi:MAG: hypothetical protein N4A65_00920 [Cohaesibacter sp.]|nr:hypothetical protein [Cohaesibacter sp.]
MDIQVYNYDAATREFIGASVAKPNPRAPEEPLLPAHATFSTPPVLQANQVAVFENEAWVIKADFRGHIYFLSDGTEIKITELDVVRPADALSERPVFLDEEKDKAKQKVVEFASQIGAQLTADVPEAEQKAWPLKEAAARAQIAGTMSDQDKELLDIERGLTGEDEATLVAAILTKAELFRKASAMIAGVRRKTIAAIDAVKTVEELEDILDAAKLEAETKLTELVG